MIKVKSFYPHTWLGCFRVPLRANHVTRQIFTCAKFRFIKRLWEVREQKTPPTRFTYCCASNAAVVGRNATLAPLNQPNHGYFRRYQSEPT